MFLACLLGIWILASVAPAQARHRTGRKALVGPLKSKVKGARGWGRKIDPNHPARRLVKPRALVKATVTLMDGGELAQVPRLVRKALSKVAGKHQRELRKPRVQRAVLSKLRTRLGDEAFTKAVGGRAAALKEALRVLDPPKGPGKGPSTDMNRGWGWKLLPERDRAFSDPTFLANMLRESSPGGTGMVDSSPTGAAKLFKAAWRSIAPRNTQPVAFALTGTDANNMLYNIARKAASKRLKRKVKDAEILVFDSCFGGARGKMGAAGFLGLGKYDQPSQAHVKVSSPHSYHFKPTNPKEIRRLERAEAKALKQIEQKVKGNKKPIGGLLIEPIIGAKGVLFYRPEFMAKLRTLCDRLGVPIFADEILTGGGRTGKFFAYQHYSKFEPDFVTFGKGLQVSGIATVYRNKGLMLDFEHGQTTLRAYSEPLLKGAQVMTRIKRDRLMENATRVGEYMVSKIRPHDPRLDPGHTPEKDGNHAEGPTRGLGLLVYSNVFFKGVKTATGRLMPPLTLTRKDVDKIFARRNISSVGVPKEAFRAAFPR